MRLKVNNLLTPRNTQPPMETTGLFFTPETAELDYKTLAASPAPYLSRIKAHSPKSALSTHSKQHAIILGRRK